MRFLIFAAALLLTPLVASAAPAASADKPAPATAEQIAAARAEADRIITAEPGASQWFENVTDSALPAVRHKPSGLECSFEPGSSFNSVGLFDGAAPGENASCHTQILGIDLSIYAARYTAQPTLQQSFDSNVATIRNRFPSLRPYEGPSVSVTSSALPTSKQAKFIFRSEHGDAYTGLTIALVEDWTVKLRITGPLANASEAQMVEAVTWAARMDQFTKVHGR